MDNKFLNMALIFVIGVMLGILTILLIDVKGYSTEEGVTMSSVEKDIQSGGLR